LKFFAPLRLGVLAVKVGFRCVPAKLRIGGATTGQEMDVFEVFPGSVSFDWRRSRRCWTLPAGFNLIHAMKITDVLRAEHAVCVFATQSMRAAAFWSALCCR
jgi:hypothetical protein